MNKLKSFPLGSFVITISLVFTIMTIPLILSYVFVVSLKSLGANISLISILCGWLSLYFSMKIGRKLDTIEAIVIHLNKVLRWLDTWEYPLEGDTNE